MTKQTVPLPSVYRLLNPGCVVVVSVGDGDGDNLFALTWNMPVKKQPAMAALLCGKGHHSYGFIERSGELAINIVSASHVDGLFSSGKMSGRDVEDKWAKVGFTRAPAAQIKAPLVAEAVASLECRVQQTVDLDRSALLVVEIVAAIADPAHFEDGMWTFARGLRLIHHLSGSRFCVSEYDTGAGLTVDLPN